MLRTTIGQLAVNHGLPKKLRDYARVLDKKGIEKLLQTVAEEMPDEYRDIVQHIATVGHHAATLTGGNSFGLDALRMTVAGRRARQELKDMIRSIYLNGTLSDDDKEQQVVKALSDRNEPLTKEVLRETLSEHNPLGMQVLSGARGNATNLRSLRGMDLLYVDHRNRPIPIPILHSYSEGLTPAEYYAGTFGARKGVLSTKFAVQDSGFFSKQLNQIAHRLIVTGLDNEEPDDPAAHVRGLPVETDDPDNEGALLAIDHGGYKKNTVLTPQILSDLKQKGVEKLLVRSPLTGGHPYGGLYARDLGIREKGGLSPTGDFVGIAAAQALSEPLTQATLSEKHKGGVATGAPQGPGGFQLINQLVQVPKVFRGAAAHAQVDGKVHSVRQAAQGGHYINVNGKDHYVGRGYGLKVKPGDTVEAGDVLSEGLPNPSEIVAHKGIGEGRRYFANAFRDAYKSSGIGAHRRNIEIMARGLIDHVELDDEWEDGTPGDIVPYSHLEHRWKPRDGHKVLKPSDAKGTYLERPVLHYSIGTRVQPSVIKTLSEHGVSSITTHSEPPPFRPTMIRGMENLAHDKDWMTRFLGSYLKKNFLKGVHSGSVSDERGTSYVPSLARGVDFGKNPPVKGWDAGDVTPVAPTPAPSIMAQMNQVQPHAPTPAFPPASIMSRAGLSQPAVPEPMKFAWSRSTIELPGLSVEHKAGDVVQLADEDDEDWDYPIREVEHAVDHCRLAGHVDEAGEPLAVLRGTDPNGKHGLFRIYRPDPLKTKTKLYFNLGPEEHDRTMRTFAPVMVDAPTDLDSGSIHEAIVKFKAKDLAKVAEASEEL